MVRRRLIATPAAVWLVAALLGGCTGLYPAHPPSDAADPRGMVLLPSGRSLLVEVADTPSSRARGYMFRERIPEGEGMVFLMQSLDFHPFWMKNCLTALDIVWLDESWRIVHVERAVPPCKADPCPSYAPLSKSLYVLEVGAGEADGLGLTLGARITFVPPGTPPADPPEP